MKAVVYISAVIALFLSACSTTKNARVYTDDIYYTPGDQEVIYSESAPAQEEQTYRSDNNTSEKYSDGEGNTYITNNYYDDYDYYYSTRLKRYYSPYMGYGYYSSIYTDYYWYNHNPAYYGVSIYIGWGSPWYYRPYYHYPYYGYSPYYHPHHFYPYYSYNPYYGYGSYWNGYHNGYHHGYNDGYYGQGYGYGNQYGGYNDYNGYDPVGVNYGPRNSISSNSGGTGSRTSNVQSGKGGPGVINSDKANQVTAEQNTMRNDGIKVDKNINEDISKTNTVTENNRVINEKVRSENGIAADINKDAGRTNTSATINDDSKPAVTEVASENNPVLSERPRSYQPDKRAERDAETANGNVQQRNNPSSRTEQAPNRNEQYTRPSTSERQQYYPVPEKNTSTQRQQRENQYYPSRTNDNNSRYERRPSYTPDRSNDRPTYTPQRNERPSYTPPRREEHPSYTPPKRQERPSANPPSPPQRRESTSGSSGSKSERSGTTPSKRRGE